MKKGQGVQVIDGPHVTVIKAKLEEAGAEIELK